jgi:hypothetical protein
MIRPMRALFLTTSVLVALAAAVLATGCGSSDPSGSDAKTVPTTRLGSTAFEWCDKSFLFETANDRVLSIGTQGVTCEEGVAFAKGYLTNGVRPDGWSCNRHVHEEVRANDESVACNGPRGTPISVNFTLKWL